VDEGLEIVILSRRKDFFSAFLRGSEKDLPMEKNKKNDFSYRHDENFQAII
jgi:hypothetical protein